MMDVCIVTDMIEKEPRWERVLKRETDKTRWPNICKSYRMGGEGADTQNSSLVDWFCPQSGKEMLKEV